MSRTNRSAFVVVALAAGLLTQLSQERAAQAEERAGVFFLNTACISLKDAFKAAYEPSRLTGAGAFDANVGRLAMPDGTQRFLVAWDDAGKWRQNSGIEPRYSVVEMNKDGLKVLKQNAWLGSAQFNKDRLFMRPAITVIEGDAQSPGYFVMTGASEDNGTSNNPRTTVLIYDADGNPILNVVGTALGGKTYGPRGERGVDMGAIAGRDNNEQQGASDIRYIGKDPSGAHVLAMAFQENNQAAYVALYKLQIHGNGADPTKPGATITAINNAVMLQGESRHCRPTCAVAEGKNGASFACATVHANEQPAEKGITVARFDAKTGAMIGTAKDVVAPSLSTTMTAAAVQDGVFQTPRGYRFAQSLLSCADASCSSYVLETSHVMKSKRIGNNGHTPGTHSTDVVMLDGSTLGVSAFLDVGNFAHTHIVPLSYGAGSGAPAIGVLSATLSGMKPAAMQVLPLDLAAKTVGAVSPENKYSVSYFSNSGDTTARGLRNPNNQGRGFLFAISDVPNPGASGGWMAGVSSVSGVPIPTFGAGDANFMGLDLCFVPSTYLPQYTKVAPGKVIRWNEAPVGPPPDPANPSPQGASDTASPGGGRARDIESDAGGCSVSTTPARSAAMSVLAALGLVALGLRRRRGEH